MKTISVRIVFFLSVIISVLFPSGYILLPMDDTQGNHLKAYGITHTALKAGIESAWLLNYRGGSFLLRRNPRLEELCSVRGVSYQAVDENQRINILNEMKSMNMAEIKLEKSPRIAVYTPLNKNPWADAVTEVLEYAEIAYDKIYDEEVLGGKLAEYDWLHLHHEDFTGQYSKFWWSYRTQPWFRSEVATLEQAARKAGFTRVADHKLAVAKTIQLAVHGGLFMFAMCTATETIDIALAAEGMDIIPQEIDGTAILQDTIEKINDRKLPYYKTFAFENFSVNTRIFENSFSDIDYNQVNTPRRKEVTDFILFDFAAKYDPIPALLCQNHCNRIHGFFGQTTGFNPEVIKDGVIILAKSIDDSARYIHGNYGKGTFTFYGGHSPEDKNHYVGDKPPNMDIHRNSPGYRLILNNILFPSAKPPEKKT